MEVLADTEAEDRSVTSESTSDAEEQTMPEPVATGQPVTVTDADFEQKVLRSSVPVLVDIWAEWCPPCRALAPIMDDLAAEYQGRAVVAKLDHDANPVTPAKYQVKGLPTMLLFKDGQLVSTLVGLKTKEEIARLLDSLFAS
jgi:thioredoxin 1